MCCLFCLIVVVLVLFLLYLGSCKLSIDDSFAVLYRHLKKAQRIKCAKLRKSILSTFSASVVTKIVLSFSPFDPSFLEDFLLCNLIGCHLFLFYSVLLSSLACLYVFGDWCFGVVVWGGHLRAKNQRKAQALGSWNGRTQPSAMTQESTAPPTKAHPGHRDQNRFVGNRRITTAT